jgi:hypothetical protein
MKENIIKILIACEFSGVVRDAFIKRGHDATSCDLIDTEVDGPHYKGSVYDILGDGWDMMIAHPPCTYLCSSGLHWNKNSAHRQYETECAIDFVRGLMEANIPKICIENPVGCISTKIRKPDQYIQPYEFGHDASKKTGVWLKGLPLLKPTIYVEPRIVKLSYTKRPVNITGYKKYHTEYKRWANQTDSGQNKLGPSETRSNERARTYSGIAEAMSIQWG